MGWPRYVSAGAWGWLALALLGGCGSCSQRGDEAAAPETPSEPGSPAVPVGTVEGVVRLAEGVELPAYDDAALRWDERAARPPEGKCAPPKKTDRTPVTLDGDRGAAGVMVNAIDFDASPPHEPVTHEVAIRDCRLTPRLVVATRGDQLRVVNETDHPFLPARGDDPFSQSLVEGQSRTTELERGGVGHVGCQVGTACGRTDLIVLYHPVHTITGEGGRFRMSNVPAGQEISVHAWHPLLEESSVTVEVAEGETVEVELELTRRPEDAPEASEPSEHPDR